MTDDTPPNCRVCGQPIAGAVNLCNNCDLPFHLRQREDDTRTPDCGDIFVNDYLSMEFACNVCLNKAPDPYAKTEPSVGPRH